MTDLTEPTYSGLSEAYDFFNTELFADRLPKVLITLRAHKGMYGYFWGERFAVRDGDAVHELALNPAHFLHRTVEQTLSTLVHEMTHVEQEAFGKPGKRGYHNREWVELMRAVGLEPDNGKGGTTGVRVTHMITSGGRFAEACARLVEAGFTIGVGERDNRSEADKAKKRASKTKYTCPDCEANAWAKPETRLECGDCHEAMIPEGGGDDEED